MPKVYRKRKNWTVNEDDYLRSLVSLYGTRNWRAVAAGIKDRDSKQCRERWINHLDPSINKEPFTDHEWEIILNEHSTKGNSWSEIAVLLPGRTANQIKNQWHGRKRKDIQTASGEPRRLVPTHSSLSSLNMVTESELKNGTGEGAEIKNPNGNFFLGNAYSANDVRSIRSEIFNISNDGSRLSLSGILNSSAGSTVTNAPMNSDSPKETVKRNPMNIANLLVGGVPEVTCSNEMIEPISFPQTLIHFPQDLKMQNQLHSFNGNGLTLSECQPLRQIPVTLTEISPLKRPREEEVERPAEKKHRSIVNDNFLNLLAAANFVRIEESVSGIN